MLNARTLPQGVSLCPSTSEFSEAKSVQAAESRLLGPGPAKLLDFSTLHIPSLLSLRVEGLGS